MTDRSLHIVKMRLLVEARGYWFTAGGEKGSFGYYPHLKRKTGDRCYPIYPDTQISGDLLMAAKWLSACDPQNFPVEKVRFLFGAEGNQQSSRLTVTDLELCEEDMKARTGDRFVVRTRCEIKDDSRTNKEHMLASHEYAFLEGCRLEAWLYMGYFKTSEEADSAKALIRECAKLLSGFGAFRSRGYGRGKISFPEKDDKLETFMPGGRKSALPPGAYYYGINAQTHFRNRPVNPARTQLLASEMRISPERLQGWFARVYHDLYGDGDWPTAEQMAAIVFTTCYPTLQEKDHLPLAFPPPYSTLKLEDGTICDRYGDKTLPGETNHCTVDGKRQKYKPLPAGVFLTNESPPRQVNVKTEKRFRNAMDGSFVTSQSGLFTQELIYRGTRFAGVVTLKSSGDSNFLENAGWILQNVWPKINGSFFFPLNLPCPPPEASASDSAWVLTEPLSLTPENLVMGKQYQLGVIKSYNTSLENKRPRRNRIVFLPGGIMTGDCENHAQLWRGAGQTVVKAGADSSPDSATGPRNGAAPTPPPTDINSHVRKMTRSQIGNLRDFREMTCEQVKIRVEGLLDKYERWSTNFPPEHLIPQELLGRLRELSADRDINGLHKFIDGIMIKHAMQSWADKRDTYASELKKRKEAMKGGAA